MAEGRPLNCNLKTPVLLSVGNQKTEFVSGCKIIDVTFPNIIAPEIGEIRFKNYYVALLTIKVKFRVSSENNEPGADVKWKTCVRKMKLMPNAYTETGSQDFFSITKKQFSCDLINVTVLRLILQQPAPVWKDFHLENLKLFHPFEPSRPTALPAWLTDNTHTNTASSKNLEGMPSVEKLSSLMQELWALSEEASALQSSKSMGRYEVDGCYEINLLSYT
ncbi:hypothetical protein ScPMuIL_007662 [Solemya velum]